MSWFRIESTLCYRSFVTQDKLTCAAPSMQDQQSPDVIVAEVKQKCPSHVCGIRTCISGTKTFSAIVPYLGFRHLSYFSLYTFYSIIHTIILFEAYCVPCLNFCSAVQWIFFYRLQKQITVNGYTGAFLSVRIAGQLNTIDTDHDLQAAENHTLFQLASDR